MAIITGGQLSYNLLSSRNNKLKHSIIFPGAAATVAPSREAGKLSGTRVTAAARFPSSLCSRADVGFALGGAEEFESSSTSDLQLTARVVEQ